MRASAHFITPKSHTNATKHAKASPQDRAAVVAAAKLAVLLPLLLLALASGGGKSVPWPLLLVEMVSA